MSEQRLGLRERLHGLGHELADAVHDAEQSLREPRPGLELSELRAIRRRAENLRAALATREPSNDFDRIARVVAGWILLGNVELADVLDVLAGPKS